MTEDMLIGTWLLRTHRVEDRLTGTTTEPFGAQPAGVLVILPDGRMTALITPGRTTGDADPAAPAHLVAYSGQYRLLPPDRFVTSVDVASIAPWVGTEQERYYRVTGDRLDFTTASADGDAPMIGRMVWVRETSAVASGGASD